MQQCCVYGCKNIGNHSFPKDEKVRKKWEASTRLKNFRANKHQKICSEHFKPEDFIKEGKYSGLINTRRILQKGVVPSIFPWTKIEVEEDPKSIQRRQRAEKRDLKQKLLQSLSVEKCDDLAPVTNNTTNTTSAVLDFDVGSGVWKMRQVDKESKPFINLSQTNNNTEVKSQFLSNIVRKQAAKPKCDDGDKETKGNQFSWQKSTPIFIDVDDDFGKVPHVPTLDIKVEQEEEKTKDTISEDHKEYFCDNCTNSIVGFRYRCVECDNYDLCSRCEARHARHYMLRIPRPRPFKEIQSIIDAIREKIKEFSKELTDNSLALDEIKLEPDFIDPAALDPLSTPRVHTPLPAPDPPRAPPPLPPALPPHHTTETTHRKTLYVVRGDTHKPKVIQLKVVKPQTPAMMDLLKKLHLIKGNEKTHKDGNTSKRKLTTLVAESSVRDKTFKDTEKTLEHCIENISDGGNTSGKGFKRKNIEDIKERRHDEDILGGNTSKRKLTTFVAESSERDKTFKDTEKTLEHCIENISDGGNTSGKGFKRKNIEDIKESRLEEDILGW